MPFGLASTVSVFQRVMFNIFRDSEMFVRCFQDDILIFSNNEEHFKHLRMVCEKLRRGLTLKSNKCKMFRNNVEYLGHTLSGDGVVPKLSNVGIL